MSWSVGRHMYMGELERIKDPQNLWGPDGAIWLEPEKGVSKTLWKLMKMDGKRRFYNE